MGPKLGASSSLRTDGGEEGDMKERPREWTSTQLMVRSLAVRNSWIASGSVAYSVMLDESTAEGGNKAAVVR